MRVIEATRNQQDPDLSLLKKEEAQPSPEFEIFSSQNLTLIPGISQKGLILSDESIETAFLRFLQAFTPEVLLPQIIENRKKTGFYSPIQEEPLNQKLLQLIDWYKTKFETLSTSNEQNGSVLERLQPFITSAEQRHIILLLLLIYGDCPEFQAVKSSELLQIAIVSLFKSKHFRADYSWKEFLEKHIVITMPEFEVEKKKQTTIKTVSQAIRQEIYLGLELDTLEQIASYHKGINSYIETDLYQAMWQFIVAQPWGEISDIPNIYNPGTNIPVWKPIPELLAPNSFINEIEEFIRRTATPPRQETEPAPKASILFSLAFLQSPEGQDQQNQVPPTTEQTVEWERVLNPRNQFQRTALMETQKNLTTAPTEIKEWNIVGETWYSLVFPALDGAQFLQLLTATAPLTFYTESFGDGIVLQATESDFRLKDETPSLKYLHRHIPGMSLFDTQRQGYLDLLQPYIDLDTEKKLVAGMLNQMLSFIFFSSKKIFPVIHDYFQCSDEKILIDSENDRIKFISAVMSQTEGSTDAERLLNILKEIHTHLGNKNLSTFGWVKNDTDNTISFLIITDSKRNIVTSIVFKQELVEQNRIMLCDSEGKTCEVQLSRLVEKNQSPVSIGKIKGTIQNDQSTNSTKNPTITPCFSWRERDETPSWISVIKQPAATLTEEEQKEKIARQLLPEQVIEYFNTKGFSCNLAGGLAIAAFYPEILQEWWKHTELGAQNQMQEMKEAQVILFPAWFEKLFAEIIPELEAQITAS